MPPGTIPSFLEKCLLEVEARGLTEVGICEQSFLNLRLVYGLNGVPDRIAGATSEVTALKDALNRGKPILIRYHRNLVSLSPAGLWPITPSTDIYAVCDLIKTWFRVLPEPAFPSYSYHDIIRAMRKTPLKPSMSFFS